MANSYYNKRAPYPCDFCCSHYSEGDIWTHWTAESGDEYMFCQDCTYVVLGEDAVYKPPTWEEQKARWDEINKYRESKGLFRL